VPAPEAPGRREKANPNQGVEATHRPAFGPPARGHGLAMASSVARATLPIDAAADTVGHWRHELHSSRWARAIPCRAARDHQPERASGAAARGGRRGAHRRGRGGQPQSRASRGAAPDRRRLRAARRARPRRHGHRLPGAGSAPRALRLRQGAAARGGDLARPARALRAGGARDQRPQPPQHLHPLRARRARGAPLPGPRVDRGRDLAAARRSRRPHRRAPGRGPGGARARGGPRGRDRAPRHQARQHHGAHRRHRQGAGLRPGAPAPPRRGGPAVAVDRGRRADGHGALHVPRAGARRARRPPLRRLLAGDRPLRAGRRTAPLRGPERPPHPGRDRRGDPTHPARRAPRAARGARRARHAHARQGSRRAPERGGGRAAPARARDRHAPLRQGAPVRAPPGHDAARDRAAGETLVAGDHLRGAGARGADGVAAGGPAAGDERPRGPGRRRGRLDRGPALHQRRRGARRLLRRGGQRGHHRHARARPRARGRVPRLVLRVPGQAGRRARDR